MRCPSARVPFLSDPFRSAPLHLCEKSRRGATPSFQRYEEGQMRVIANRRVVP